MKLTKDNAVVGMFFHQGSIMGNLRVQVVDKIGVVLDSKMIFAKYLVPRNTRTGFARLPTKEDTASWYLEGEYKNVEYLVVIEDPIEFLARNFLCEQARYIIEHDVRGLGQRVYERMKFTIAHDVYSRWKHGNWWKERVDNKMWEFVDYDVPDTNLKLREVRGWSKDRMFNGKRFWAIIEPDGQRQEWTDLITCLKRLEFWFSDEVLSRYEGGLSDGL